MIQESNSNVRAEAGKGGETLRHARLEAGLGLQEVAARLRMPVRVVEALEQGRWQDIGAPVFVRGQLRSYARLLDVDLGGLLESEVAPVVPVDLVSHAHTPRLHRMVESAGRRVVYVVITAAIAVPVWLLATRPHADDVPAAVSLDAVPPAQVDSALPVAPSDPAQPPSAAVASRETAPYVASLAPQVNRAQVGGPATLDFAFSGESWMQVTGRDGRVLEQALMRGGDSRSFNAAEVGSVKLGNASVVRVQQAGSIVDLTPYQRANVARFAVSSDGSVAPAE